MPIPYSKEAPQRVRSKSTDMQGLFTRILWPIPILCVVLLDTKTLVLTKKRLILFASGSGSNVERIAQYFASEEGVAITGVFSNKRDAQVFERCRRLHINAYAFNKSAFQDPDGLLTMVRALEPDLIVLAGFLWKIPIHFIDAYPEKIINIHPALLPKYGGKGMYGTHVHEAVKANGDETTGITIHYVNAHYDEARLSIRPRPLWPRMIAPWILPTMYSYWNIGTCPG